MPGILPSMELFILERFFLPHLSRKLNKYEYGITFVFR